MKLLRWLGSLFRPRHTVDSVLHELVVGYVNETVTLPANKEQTPPVRSLADLIRVYVVYTTDEPAYDLRRALVLHRFISKVESSQRPAALSAGTIEQFMRDAAAEVRDSYLLQIDNTEAALTPEEVNRLVRVYEEVTTVDR